MSGTRRINLCVSLNLNTMLWHQLQQNIIYRDIINGCNATPSITETLRLKTIIAN